MCVSLSDNGGNLSVRCHPVGGFKSRPESDGGRSRRGCRVTEVSVKHQKIFGWSKLFLGPLLEGARCSPLVWHVKPPNLISFLPPVTCITVHYVCEQISEFTCSFACPCANSEQLAVRTTVEKAMHQSEQTSADVAYSSAYFDDTRLHNSNCQFPTEIFGGRIYETDLATKNVHATKPRTNLFII